MLEAMKRQALQISARTGLKEDTCLDLLLSGWSYRQQENEHDKWVSPMENLKLPPKR